MAERPTSVAVPSGQADVLIYDAQCRLCVAVKQRLEKLAQESGPATVRFVPYDSAEAAVYLKERYRPGLPKEAFLVDHEGRISSGLDAFLPLLPGIKGGVILHWLIRRPWLKPLASLLYRLLARYRYCLFGSARPSAF